MVSSGLASLGPDSPYARYISVAYGSSKTALNAVTVQYANALRDRYPKLRINAADPGHCATDLNGWTGPRTAEQGAEIIVRLACVPDDGPTGRFFDENGPVAW